MVAKLGQGYQCFLEQNNIQFRIQFGMYSTVVPGESLSVRPLKFKRLGCLSAITTIHNLTISAPTFNTPPEIDLKYSD